MLLWPIVGALIVGIIYLMNEGRLRKLGEFFGSFMDYLAAQQATGGGRPPARRFGEGYQREADEPTPLVESDPKYAIVHYNRGNAYFRQGNAKEAISEYNKAIELNPTYASVYYNRGLVYKSLGKTEEALADLEQFIFFADDPALVEQAKKEMEELRK